MDDFLVVGDWHVGVGTKGVPHSYVYVSTVISQIEEYALQHGIDTIIQLGDVHDSVAVDEDQRFFVLDLFKKSKLNWHVIFGNHDYLDASYTTIMYYVKLQKEFGILPNVQFYLEPTVAKVGNRDIAFLPWPNKSIKHKKPIICIGHFALSGARGDNGFVLKGDTKIKDNNYWIIGDLHSYQQSDAYVYPGAILQFKYGDTPNKFFLHFTGSAKKPVFEKIKIQLPYILEQKTVLEKADIKKLIRYLNARKENTFTKLKLGEQVLADYRYKDISGMERVTIEFAGKIQVEDSKESAVLIDSKHVRQQLVRRRLKKKGFDNNAITKAMKIIQQLEKDT